MRNKHRADRSGILLVDKPQGCTSHDVVGRIRRLVGQRRVGHTGTLDPLATGLLVICLGRATRLAEYIRARDKRYEGRIRLGLRTATDDAEGEVIASGPVPPLDAEALRDLEARFSGTIEQRPPVFSAVKVQGERAYAAARRGEPLDLPPRQVTVHELKLSPAGPDLLGIEVLCSQGTYVRSLARDIGEALGCGAHLAGLRRTAVGKARIEEAFTIEELNALQDAGLLDAAIRPADDALTDLDAVLLPARQAARLSHGAEIEARTLRQAEAARVYGPAGEFLAVAAVTLHGTVRPAKVLQPGG